MKNKVLVEVSVPVAEKRFDIYIPNDVVMRDLTRMIASTLEGLTDGNYKATLESILCDATTGLPYDLDKFVVELKINNGSRLILL